MTDQEVLANAPDGATHIDNCGRCHKLTNTHRGYMLLNNNGDWDYCNPATELRLIADITRIAELEKELDELKLITDKVRRYKNGSLVELFWSDDSSEDAYDSPECWISEVYEDGMMGQVFKFQTAIVCKDVFYRVALENDEIVMIEQAKEAPRECM